MGSEQPVLEYARSEEVAGDRFRLWFLLAGVVGIGTLFVPVDFGGSLVGEIVSELGREIRLGISWKLAVNVAAAASLLAPFSGLIWRSLRLRGREPGVAAGIAGLVLAIVHCVGVLGMAVGVICLNAHNRARMGIGLSGIVILGVCASLGLWFGRQLSSARGVLLLLLVSEVALYWLVWLLVIRTALDWTSGISRSLTMWGLGAVLGVVVVCKVLEMVHLLRSGRHQVG